MRVHGAARDRARQQPEMLEIHNIVEREITSA
jgi:hypothetical protein